MVSIGSIQCADKFKIVFSLITKNDILYAAATCNHNKLHNALCTATLICELHCLLSQTNAQAINILKIYQMAVGPIAFLK